MRRCEPSLFKTGPIFRWLKYLWVVITLLIFARALTEACLVSFDIFFMVVEEKLHTVLLGRFWTYETIATRYFTFANVHFFSREWSLPGPMLAHQNRWLSILEPAGMISWRLPQRESMGVLAPAQCIKIGTWLSGPFPFWGTTKKPR